MNRALLALGGGALLAYGVDRARSSAALASFQGQTALVTGATRGLGLCLARQLAEQHCQVAILARSEEELAGAKVDLEGLGGKVIALRCDVSREEDVAAAVASVKARFGQIDTLINNAGTIVVGPVESMTLDEFRLCMDTMFWGTVYPTLGVLPDMLARGSGNIMTITSIGGRVTVPHLLPYCCAKAAGVAFSEGLRMETSGKGVKVLTAVPGLMRNGAHLNALFRGDQKAEYGWFSASASLPGISMDPTQVARQLLVALARDKAEIHVTLAAEILARVHGLFPGLVTDLAGLVNRLLPSGSTGPTLEGAELDREMPEWMHKLTFLGKAAARDYQQHKKAGSYALAVD